MWVCVSVSVGRDGVCVWVCVCWGGGGGKVCGRSLRTLTI